MEACTCDFSTQEVKAGLLKFEISLGYIVSFRLVWDTVQESIKKKKKKFPYPHYITLSSMHWRDQQMWPKGADSSELMGAWIKEWIQSSQVKLNDFPLQNHTVRSRHKLQKLKSNKCLYNYQLGRELQSNELGPAGPKTASSLILSHCFVIYEVLFLTPYHFDLLTLICR